MKSKSISRPFGVIGCMLVALLAQCAPVHAAFPGANGKIAGTSYDATDASVDGNVFTLNPDGSGFTYVGSTTTFFEGLPAWSPGSSKIAFVTNRDGNYEVYSMNADGTGQTRLSNNPAYDSNPAWSPDGSKIAFETNRDGNTEVYVMNADGTGQTRLTNNPAFDGNPAWSPDGSKIAFETDRDGNDEIYTMNADGTGATNLTHDPGPQSWPNWSPDGSKIAYSGQSLVQPPPRLDQIFVMNSDGTGQTQITSDGAAYSGPAWSPDGTKIADLRYHDPTDNSSSIAVMNPDGSDEVLVYNSPTDDFHGSPYEPVDWGATVSGASSGYPRPKGAGPFQTYLVPAYKQCVFPNAVHKPPLSDPSCNPPQLASNTLTVGTPDANGQGAKSIDFVKFAVHPGTSTTSPDESIAVSLTDIRKQSDLSDYTGEVQMVAIWRITDQDNGPSGTDAATVIDIPFPVNFSCSATADPSVGSTCAIATTANAIIPGAIQAHKRTIEELGQIQVNDGGPDGLNSTADNTLFMDEGIFIP